MKPTLTMDKITMTVIEWSKETGINYNVLMKRKDAGWTDRKTLTTPVAHRKKLSEDELRVLELAGKLPVGKSGDPETMHILQFGNINELLRTE